MHGNHRQFKFPPWFDTCAKYLFVILAILGLGVLWHPARTDAVTTTKLNCNSGSTCWHATCAQSAETIVMVAISAGNLPQNLEAANQATCTVCFGHCTFYGYSNATYATASVTDHASGAPMITFATKMNSDGGDPTIAVALLPTTPAGNTNAAAVTTNYYISTMPVGLDPAAYTSEGATRRNTGHASMYAEVSPTFRFASPLSMKARYSRQPDRATRASPAHSTFNRRPLSRYC